MAFTGSGDVEMVQDPRTGRLQLQWGPDGNPVYSSTRSHKVASLLIEHRGRWLQDKTGARGSVLYRIKNDTSRTPSEVESAARDALKPLVDAGEISAVVAVATRQSGGRYRLLVNYRTPDGVQHSIGA